MKNWQWMALGLAAIGVVHSAWGEPGPKQFGPLSPGSWRWTSSGSKHTIDLSNLDAEAHPAAEARYTVRQAGREPFRLARSASHDVTWPGAEVLLPIC